MTCRTLLFVTALSAITLIATPSTACSVGDVQITAGAEWQETSAPNNIACAFKRTRQYQNLKALAFVFDWRGRGKLDLSAVARDLRERSYKRSFSDKDIKYDSGTPVAYGAAKGMQYRDTIKEVRSGVDLVMNYELIELSGGIYLQILWPSHSVRGFQNSPIFGGITAEFMASVTVPARVGQVP
jgi:hypothetical protein